MLMRLCKIQLTYYGHCVDKTIRPVFVYEKPLTLDSKEPQQTQLSDGAGYFFLCFALHPANTVFVFKK